MFNDNFWLNYGKLICTAEKECRNLFYEKQTILGKTKSKKFYFGDQFKYISSALDHFAGLDRPRSQIKIKNTYITDIFYNYPAENIDMDPLKYTKQVCNYINQTIPLFEEYIKNFTGEDLKYMKIQLKSLQENKSILESKIDMVL